MSESLKLGLIGQPVKHSRSPQIHQHFAEQTGRELDYRLIECAADDVVTTVADFFAGGGHGLNVTLPHKATVLPLCQHISEDAQLAEAANTLIPRPDGLRAENTDGRGLIRDLQRLGVNVTGKRIAVIGAGGAARGIIKPLLDEKPKELTWSNRNPLKLEGKEIAFAGHGPLILCANLALKGGQFDLVIHASSAGHQGLAPRLPSGLFAPGGIAYDLSYGAAALPFLAWAKEHGATVQHQGIGMLIEQAALSWQHWTGSLPETEQLHKTLLGQ
ncbi:MAG: shikimate dehydrogenase [Oceanococcus sp.]